MKRRLILLPVFALLLNGSLSAQPLRYFEFTTQCGHGNWQDTSFIAATADPAVIDSVLTDLDKPYEERRFISGAIDLGDGGYNHNAGHWFLWHFIPGQWELAEMAIEVCDGCPYSDVDADTSYWVGNLGMFCPWSGKPAREIGELVKVDPAGAENRISVYPNPAGCRVFLHRSSASPLCITINGLQGQKILELTNFSGEEINLPALNEGLYFLRCQEENDITVVPLRIKR
jgi:hypothetical protein